MPLPPEYTGKIPPTFSYLHLLLHTIGRERVLGAAPELRELWEALDAECPAPAPRRSVAELLDPAFPKQPTREPYPDDFVSRVVGVWKLRSCIYFEPDGAIVDYIDRRTTGLLSFSQDGFVDVQFMNAERGSFSSRDWRSVPQAERAAAFDSYQAYFGTFDLDVEEGLTYTYISCAMIPTWLGTIEVRRPKVHTGGQYMTIIVPEMVIGGRERLIVVSWVRASKTGLREEWRRVHRALAAARGSES